MRMLSMITAVLFITFSIGSLKAEETEWIPWKSSILKLEDSDLDQEDRSLEWGINDLSIWKSDIFVGGVRDLESEEDRDSETERQLSGTDNERRLNNRI